MTEQEIVRRINSCEQQITANYENLKNSARDVGETAMQAARAAQSRAVSAAKSDKNTKTFTPLLLVLLGLLIVSSSWFIGLLLIIGGVALSYNLNQKAASSLKKVEQQYSAIVSSTEYQRNNLNSTISTNDKI